MAILSALLGVTAAVRGGWSDRLIQVGGVIGFALPYFWLALMLVVLFAVELRCLPATGNISFGASPSACLASLVLPVAALAFSGIASSSQQVRGAVIDALRQDYVRTLRARGVSPRSVLFRHVLRNAMPAALTVLSVQFIGLLGGAAIIGRVFAIPGLGLPKAAVRPTPMKCRLYEGESLSPYGQPSGVAVRRIRTRLGLPTGQGELHIEH
ncbi:ABC transporter permease [Pseudoroseicyclus sp. CLL3-39]|uniref:ABC transporter permease n=2 Tax=Pseudoroseicyclus tamaricis TaxID=2705421 RepID=A0A6B2JMY8_9RHOB|nr:ABC transporter permease [Pseudoroseicyclus tamaricis]